MIDISDYCSLYSIGYFTSFISIANTGVFTIGPNRPWPPPPLKIWWVLQIVQIRRVFLVGGVEIFFMGGMEADGDTESFFGPHLYKILNTPLIANTIIN